MGIGTVHRINPSRGMIGIKTEEGFSIFELLSDFELNVGDEVSWEDDHPLGGAEVTNLSTGQSEEVYFQNHCVHINHLNQQLLF